MKKSFWFLFAFFLIIMIGCQPAISTPRVKTPTPDNISSNNNSNSSGNQSSSSNSSNTDNANNNIINIPARNQPAPNGILEQLSWGGTGGPEAPKQPCGNCDLDINGSSLIAYGFEPNQKIELLIYRNTGGNTCWDTAEYVTTITVQVDKNGQLNSGLTGPVNSLFVVFAYDVNTNKKLYERPGVYGFLECNLLDSSQNACAGAPPQRLEINEMAYVCTANDSVKLRERPGKNYPILRSLVPGADIRIIGGPRCGDNWSWWEVETESGYIGWMSEGGDNIDKYFLCPAP